MHTNKVKYIFVNNNTSLQDISNIKKNDQIENDDNIPLLINKINKDDFLFSISPSYVSVLPDNGVEAVSLDNNHVRDHGEEGLADTKAALENAGVIYSTPLEIGVYDYKGMIQVAMLSYNCIDRYGDGFSLSTSCRPMAICQCSARCFRDVSP